MRLEHAEQPAFEADDDTLIGSGERAAAREVPWPELVALVRRQVRSIAGPCRDLDDLTQTALEQLVRSVGRFEGRSELSTFAYRISVRVVLNHWRSWKRWLRRFELTSERNDDARAEGPDVSQVMVERERYARLRRALDRIDPMRRVVITLADLEELPASQIAEILDCPEATVRSRLRRGRADLVALLSKDPLFSEGGAR